jgi:hypothetical protein
MPVAMSRTTVTTESVKLKAAHIVTALASNPRVSRPRDVSVGLALMPSPQVSAHIIYVHPIPVSPVPTAKLAPTFIKKEVVLTEEQGALLSSTKRIAHLIPSLPFREKSPRSPSDHTTGDLRYAYAQTTRKAPAQPQAHSGRSKVPRAGRRRGDGLHVTYCAAPPQRSRTVRGTGAAQMVVIE